MFGADGFAYIIRRVIYSRKNIRTSFRFVFPHMGTRSAGTDLKTISLTPEFAESSRARFGELKLNILVGLICTKPPPSEMGHSVYLKKNWGLQTSRGFIALLAPPSNYASARSVSRSVAQIAYKSCGENEIVLPDGL